MGCLKLDILEENYSPLKVVRDDLKTTVKPCTGVYLFGFNGMEKEDDLYGTANAYDFGARLLDVRLGKWLSTDPEYQLYPYSSPYVAFGDNPIYFIDPDGKRIKGVKWRKGQPVFKKNVSKDVQRYVNIRMQTNQGMKSLKKMIRNPLVLFNINIMDEKLILRDPETGKMLPASGVAFGTTFFRYIHISTNKITKTSEMVTINSETWDVEPYTGEVDEGTSSMEGKTDEELTKYERAVRNSGKEDYVQENGDYQSEDELINGIGAHEEVHATENFKEGASPDPEVRIYQNEKSAMETEIEAREEWSQK